MNYENLNFIRNNYENFSISKAKEKIKNSKINYIKNHPYYFIYKKYKFSSQERIKKYKNEEKYKFELTIENFIKLIKQECHYCGKFPSNKIQYENIFIVYNGIDRFNNDKGYTKENCVSCCGTCNHAKATMDNEDFLKHFAKLIKYQMEKK